jgi:hypothetical protein
MCGEKLDGASSEKTDSSAALRNDKQKNRQRQKQKEQATTKAKTNAGVLPLRQAQGQNDNCWEVICFKRL